MSTFSIDGLISGLDTTSIIDAMLDVERAPINRLEVKKAEASSRIAAFQNLNANLLAFRVSADRLSRTSSFESRGVTSSNTDIINASVENYALAGSHTIVVSQLAQAHSISSDSQTEADTELNISGDILVNGRTVTIQDTDTLRDIAAKIDSSSSDIRASVVRIQDGEFRLSISRVATGSQEVELADTTGNVLSSLGLTDGTEALRNVTGDSAVGFRFGSATNAVGDLMNLVSPQSGTVTFDADNAFSVDIDLSTDSLESIVDKFNAAKGSSNLEMTIVDDTVNGATVKRLQVTDSSGLALDDFTDDNNILETLGFISGTIKNENQAAQDAKFSVDGLELTRSSNTVTDVLSGVTLFLSSADENETVTLNITQSDANAVDAIQSFVSAYNTAMQFIKDNASYDSETEERGILLGDSTVLSAQQRLFSIIQRSVPALPSTHLSELNSGSGVRAGSIEITDRAGNSAIVDLTGVSTVQDVIDAINNQSGIEIEASVNSRGTGIDLKDTSDGTGLLTVAEAGSTTAEDLGLLGSFGSATVGGTDIGTGERLNLSSIGISATLNGTLSLDSAKLTEALQQNREEVMALFTTEDVGVGDYTKGTLDYLTGAQNGAIKTRTDGLQSTIEGIDSDIERYNKRVDQIEQRLRNQFAAMEASLAEIQSQGDYLLSQLEQISQIGKKN